MNPLFLNYADILGSHLDFVEMHKVYVVTSKNLLILTEMQNFYLRTTACRSWR